MTTTFQGTVNVTVRVNTPVVGTTAGDLSLSPTGPNVIVGSGKTLSSDQVTSTTAATDLVLNATGPNINCSGKNLTNVGGITSPVLQAVAAGPTGTTDATPTALLTLPVPANTCFLVTANVVAISPTGGTAVDAAAFHEVLRVTNRAGTLTLSPMVSSVSGDAGLNAASVAYGASGANLVATVTGVAGLGVRWTALVSYTSAST